MKEQAEFDDLKQALCSDSVMLHHPDWSKPFLVQTDASAKGLGAVLSQIGPGGKEHPVRYASRTLQPLESKWTTREQELIAVIWACETFHRYIWGQHFTIQTDHANLQWLQSVSLLLKRAVLPGGPCAWPNMNLTCNTNQAMLTVMLMHFLRVL